MRLVTTQANTTKKHLNNAKKIVVEAVKQKSAVNLEQRIQAELAQMSSNALSLVKDLADYEANYTYKKIRSNAPKSIKSDIQPLAPMLVAATVDTTRVKASTNGRKLTIKENYDIFSSTKTKQYMQLVNDYDLNDDDEEEFESKVDERTNGMFSSQNKVLAGLAVIGIANSIRNRVSRQNNLQVEWSLDLELNNCEYCEDMAANSPYDAEDVEGEIPVHANCGCTLIPLFEDTDDDEE